MAYINGNEVLFSSNVTMTSEGGEGVVFDLNATKGGTDTAVNIAHSGNGAKGEYSLAQGYGTIAGDSDTEPSYYAHSHDESDGNVLEGHFAHAEGNGTWAKGVGSHAEGYRTKATSQYTHAEGFSTFANGRYSHVEGRETKTVNGALCAHAEGYKTGASGKYAHAEGYSTKAIGKASHAGGIGSEAREEAQTVVGKYNADSEDALFIVGDGSSEDERSNAFEVISNGNTTAIKIGNTEITEEQLNSLLALLNGETKLSLTCYANYEESELPEIDGYGNYHMHDCFYMVNETVARDNSVLSLHSIEETGGTGNEYTKAVINDIPNGGFVELAFVNNGCSYDVETANNCVCENIGSNVVNGIYCDIYRVTRITAGATIKLAYSE